MSARKKRLILIQAILLIAAMLLLYIFYYQDNINKKPSEEVKTENENLEKLSQSNYFEDVEYKGIDANGNRYLLQSKIATFGEENPELVNMTKMNATFYFKDGKILKVSGETGTYNNKSNDMEFRDNVIVVQADNRIFADNLDYLNLKRLIKVYGNVRGESLDGNFTSDVLNLNIDNQSVDVFMINNEQVKINLEK
ncbi:MAG: LPS export ABC transporter periplasmic protein LptC [Candidatus Pelagibacter sp. TMED263]|nr:MAG: LPS export ABC transporter periplasmic protein LptC [Candidatus Pelagibacter sp. TMED263]|tara:strand:+ start:471 stop:1058 length:588 start_codon:yes stop_codon:yes gene_type:complete